MKKEKETEEKIAHMVLVKGRGEPTYIHKSYKLAYQEAERLAIKEPNRLIRILQVVEQIRGEVKPVKVPIVRLPKDWGRITTHMPDGGRGGTGDYSGNGGGDRSGTGTE